MDNNQNNPFAFDDANTSSADTTSTDANVQATDGFNAQPAFNASYDTQTTNANDAQATAFDTQYQQPVYSANTQVANSSKGLAIAGLIVSIIGLLLSCCYGCGIILAIVALILSIVGIKKCPTAKGMAIAGTIISAIGIIISIIWICVMLFNPTFQEAFKEGFENGYNGYNNRIVKESTDTTEDILNNGVTSGDATETTDSTTANEVVNVGEKKQFSILGKTCTIGDAIANTGLTYIINDDDQAEVKVGVEPGDDVTGYITDASGNKVAYIGLDNLTDSVITDAGQLALTYIAADYYWDADYNEINSDICVYSGIHIGSTVDEVKAAFGTENSSYTSDNRGSLTYCIDDNTNIEIGYEDNIVTDITVSYYE